jgi:hypothetical protein
MLSTVARTGGDLDRSLEQLPAPGPHFRRDILSGALEGLGAFEALREALGGTHDPEPLLARLHGWLDALRTRKLLDALRSGGLSSLAFRQALAEAPFTGLSTSTEEDPEELLSALADRERELAGTSAGVPPLLEGLTRGA